ncbi:hypothetical protein OROMI_006835 [Orobanche minor]
MASSPLYSIQSVCDFARATLGKNVRFMKAADNFGEVMAARKISIIYGGGNTGLRGRVAASASMGDTKIFGVILKLLADSPLVGPTYGNELRVRFRYAGGSITDALMGITGHPPKIGGDAQHQRIFYGILALLDSLVEKGISSPPSRRLLLCATTPEELIDKFLAYMPEPDPTGIRY